MLSRFVILSFIWSGFALYAGAYTLPSYKGRIEKGGASAIKTAATADDSHLSEAEKIKRKWQEERLQSMRRGGGASNPEASNVVHNPNLVAASPRESWRHSMRSDASSISAGKHSVSSHKTTGSDASVASTLSAISVASQLSGIAPLDASFKAGAQKKGPILILSIDGASVRGLVQLRILQVLEERLRKELGEPDLKITDVFDLFAGTSAGSINTAALMSPDPVVVGDALDLPLVGERLDARYSLSKPTVDPVTGKEETLNTLAKRLIDSVFRPSHKKRLRDVRVLGGLAGSKYTIKPLEAILQDITFIGKTNKGESLYATMADTVKPTVITAWDVNNREVVIFNTFDACRQPMSPLMNPALWFAARASASAPIYFKPLELHDTVSFINDQGDQVDQEITRALIDAGLYVMSPTIVAWAEAMKIYPDRHYVILSIGGGFTTKPRKVATKGNTAGSLIKIIKPAIESALEGQPRLMERALSMVPDITYLRLNFEVQNSSFDDVSDKNLESLNKSANDVVKTPQFNFIVKALVDAIKKQRADKTKKAYKKCLFPESLEYSKERFSRRFTSNNIALDVSIVPGESKDKKEQRILEVQTAVEGQNTEPEIIHLH